MLLLRQVPLLLSVGALLLNVAPAASEQPAAALTILTQSESLPDDFRAHFFNAPLSVRVELNGEFVGDAMIMLSEKNTVQLLEFTDTETSEVPAAARNQLGSQLSEPVALGACESDCPGELTAVHYSLSTATLSVVSRDAPSTNGSVRYHTLPEGGSRGLIINNQLNVFGGGNTQTTGRYALNAQGSVGSWSTYAGLQADRSSYTDKTTHSVQNLYAGKELEGHAVRAGLFVPDTQGVMRQSVTRGGRTRTSAGIMIGSSDTLLADTKQESAYPVYVTANRAGVAEIYRDGVLINSQPVQPGLQMIDTLPLPGGIYPVEIRVTEGGLVTSTMEEIIYKPAGWGLSGQRVKYNAWVGKEQTLLDNSDSSDTGEGGISAGTSVSWMPHPRLTTGIAVQHTDGRLQTGMSADWMPAEKISISGNAFHSQGYGNGFDLQGSWRYDSGNIMVNHSRSWRDNANANVHQSSTLEHHTGVALSQRLDGGDMFTSRLSHSSSNGSLGADLSYSTTYNVGDTPVRLRLSGFDRPYSEGEESLRNRGISLDLSLSLGRSGRSYSASLGSRNDNRGQRETYASLTANQEFESDTVRRISGTITGDSSGVGFNGSAGFTNPYLNGDAWGQRDALGGGLSGGLNLENSIAVGGGAVAVTPRGMGQRHDTGMIIDVESDDPQAKVRVDDVRGGSTTLRAGRNFVPVTAYRSGQVQFDIDDKGSTALHVHPPVADYHLNRGGVGYTKVRVMKTVTVLGRLVDGSGQPLSGAKVVNHAGQSVSEADGFFSLEMHELTPELAVTHRSGTACNIQLPTVTEGREGDTLLAGTLICG